MSVLTGLQRRVPSDADYGSSSGRLFVSPVSGAIAGWLGVLLVSALANPDIKILGPVLQRRLDRDRQERPRTSRGSRPHSWFSERLLDPHLRAEAESAITSGAAADVDDDRLGAGRVRRLAQVDAALMRMKRPITGISKSDSARAIASSACGKWCAPSNAT